MGIHYDSGYKPAPNLTCHMDMSLSLRVELILCIIELGLSAVLHELTHWSIQHANERVVMMLQM